MAILQEHIKFYRKAFSMPDFFKGKVATIGVQEIRGNSLPKDFNFKDFKSLIEAKGAKVETIDYFDEHADHKLDLNLPIPKNLHNRYDTVIDIGSLEHIFDTKQAMDNCFKMLKVGGFYMLHTPVQGYFRDGLHTFNPEGLIGALKLNGFDILSVKYGTLRGTPMIDPTPGRDVNIWILAKKKKNMKNFVVPQQDWWKQVLKEDFEMPWNKRKRNEKGIFAKIKERLVLAYYAAGFA